MIDEYWTWVFYGYHSNDLKTQSNKPIVARCDGCCQYRVLTIQGYNELCKLCASHARKGIPRPPFSEEWKNNISTSAKGKKRTPFTDEHRHNMSIAAERRIRKPVSDEARRNISIAGQKRPPMTDIAKQHHSAGAQKIHYEDWNGYAVQGQYCEKFDEACKERIREKYNRLCFVCDKNEENNGRRLDVHHVDMNKDQGCNRNEWKLVPLCKSCHGKAHFDPMKSRLQFLSTHQTNFV
jgi:hypothetical protein